MISPIEWIKDRIEISKLPCSVRRMAIQYGFSLTRHNVPIFLSGGAGLGRSFRLDWRKKLEGEGVEKISSLCPLETRGRVVASYRVVRAWSGRFDSDLAAGDSGHYGDLVLVRIDEVPESNLQSPSTGGDYLPNNQTLINAMNGGPSR